MEDLFVENEYMSAVIGDVSNFNVRRTLELAQRIMTSAALRVEDIFKAVATGQRTPIPHAKFMNALLRGDYEFYRQSDLHLIYPIFQASDKIRQSPLIITRILALLYDAKNFSRNVEDKHLRVQSIVDYFSAIGHSEVGIEVALIPMLQVGLIEAYDPSVQDISSSQRLAITPSGIRHLNLALYENVFLEQMAMTTAISDYSIAERIRSAYKEDANFFEKMSRIKSLFVEYLLSEDGANLTIPPEGRQYDSQRHVTDLIKRLDPSKFVETPSVAAKTPIEEQELTVECTVDYFDPDKRYGFVDVEGQSSQAYIHLSTLKDAGIDRVFDGDSLLCTVASSQKGLYVQRVSEFLNRTEFEELDGIVIRIFRDRRYGFIRVPTKAADAFFRFAVFPEGIPQGFSEGSMCRVQISPDKTGEGFQVRRFV